MRPVRHFSDGIDCAQYIRHACDGDEFCSGRKQTLIMVEIETSLWSQLNKFENGTPFPGDYLPGHKVGMVFHFIEDDLITAFEEMATPGLGHHVDRHGGT